MDGLTASCCVGRFVFLPSTRTRSARRRPAFLALASSGDDPKLDKWDQMELKFGQFIGEDPKLTLAKIMGRKSNPEVSYLEIEKSFAKKKGKSNAEIVNIPLDWSKQEAEPSNSTSDMRFSNKNLPVDTNLNLVRPVMKKVIKAETTTNDVPVYTEMKPSQSSQKINTKDSSVSKVILRKPSALQADDIETEKSSKLEIKPNLYLKMRKNLNRSPSDMTLLKKPMDRNDNFSDITLLKKPEPVWISNPNQESMPSPDSDGLNSGEASILSGDVKLLDASAMSSDKKELDDEVKASQVNIGLQRPEHRDPGTPEREVAITQPLDLKPVHSSSNSSVQAAMLRNPQRLDPSTIKISDPGGAEKTNVNGESHNDADEIKHFQSTALGEREEIYWTRAENLLRTGEREEVELISCSSRGFVVSFGSIIGFLPYRNLGAKWKFLAFESWLRKKGFDPSLYKQNLSILGNYESQNRNIPLDSNPSQKTNQQLEEYPASDMKLEDLLETYDQEKTKFLSSFVGQRIKVSVILADRNSRKLMFSGRPKEKEEMVDKKRSLMAKLSIGDVVKCSIKKITYFGIFVEVEGVPALIHQSEVSWDATLDPSTYFKIGQIIEAKVHQLDFALERITLSLKQIMPDPLVEALESLESIVGDRSSLDGSLETAQADVEWADVESLIKELGKIKGIERVSKGRFFLSPGLAPTFQVYMASVFENQYKLLARSGNKVQEVIVQASLDKEQMKAAILTCTNRVE
ncbi:uncharacterized protein LOC131224640 isoform X2 [Magnolia sinica]|uniref:uncharacterized protein LOC131224640 isoform X2 n=1 Tax=Magnolia sinica TaxID=86752 RepID=UPI0026587B77|nr:uncharacterized protein LOC131224640 isoform X2 [Magnolia sinica]